MIDALLAKALPAFFSGAMLFLFTILVKYLRDIANDVRALKISVPVLTQSHADLKERVAALENSRRAK